MSTSKPVLASITLSGNDNHIYACTRTAIMSPSRGLRAVEHIEINDTIERNGVTYYILNIYRTNASSQTTKETRIRVVGTPVRLNDDTNDNLTMYTLEKRFSEFESLRNQLSARFETLHTDHCVYCDRFLDFLSCSTINPGLRTKMMTGVTERKQILSTFINHAVQLASSDFDEEPVTQYSQGFCDGWTVIPPIIENFIREPTSRRNL